jgi:hypothetical protein
MFNLGKSTASSTQDKKKSKIDHAEQRIKETFNIGGGGSENQDELKRKREDFAVQLRKKNRYVSSDY